VIGRKKKYINIFGSFTESFNYIFLQARFPSCPQTVTSNHRGSACEKATYTNHIFEYCSTACCLTEDTMTLPAVFETRNRFIHFEHVQTWGTGIRGLMRGVASWQPSPKVTRSY